MKRRDLLSQFGDVAIVVNHVISDRQALCAAHLGCQDTSRIGFRTAVTGHEAPYLRVFVAIDNQDPVYKRFEG